MLILDVTFNILVLPLLPAEPHFQFTSFVCAHMINQQRAHSCVLAKMSPNPQSPTQTRPLASSPSTALADPGWAWHWCHSTAEPDGDTRCQTQSLTHCTAEGDTTERSGCGQLLTTIYFHHTKWNCGTLCCSTAALEPHQWPQPTGCPVTYANSLTYICSENL